MHLCNSVCQHDKMKTAETKITKLGTQIVHHDTLPTIPPMNIRSGLGDRLARVSYAPLSSASLVLMFLILYHTKCEIKPGQR